MPGQPVVIRTAAVGEPAVLVPKLERVGFGRPEPETCLYDTGKAVGDRDDPAVVDDYRRRTTHRLAGTAMSLPA